MEDRYLFKGKRLDNGEWEIGSLVMLPNGKCEITNSCVNPPDSDPMWRECVISHRVDPSTICQYTGLRDKNGNLVWENDIMVAHLDKEYPEDETYIKILWYRGGFRSKENGSVNLPLINKFDLEHFEVIGNIFDNKELLESEG